jgi:hypothetical protein
MIPPKSPPSIRSNTTALACTFHNAYQVVHAAGQPVELPHCERVGVFEFLEATPQGRALRRAS